MARKKITFEEHAVQFAMEEEEAKVRAVIATMYAILNRRFGTAKPKAKPRHDTEPSLKLA